MEAPETSTMKIYLLLSLGLVLISTLHAQDLTYDKDADWQEFAGDWLSILLASNDYNQIKEGGDMKFFITNIETHERDVIFNLYFKKGNKCVPYAMTADKREDSNVLYATYEGDNLIFIYRRDGNKAIILITKNINDGKETVIIELYGKDTDVSKKMIADFENVCKNYGIPADNIIDMTKDDYCYRNKEY